MLYLPSSEVVPPSIRGAYTSSQVSFVPDVSLALTSAASARCVNLQTVLSVFFWALRAVGFVILFIGAMELPLTGEAILLVQGAILIGVSLLLQLMIAACLVNAKEGPFTPHTADEAQARVNQLRGTAPSIEIRVVSYHNSTSTDSKGRTHSHRSVSHTATASVNFDYCVDLPTTPLDLAHGLIFLTLEAECAFGDPFTKARFEGIREALIEENKHRDVHHSVETQVQIPDFVGSLVFVGDSTRQTSYFSKKWFGVATLLGVQAPYLVLMAYLRTREQVTLRKVCFCDPSNHSDPSGYSF